MPGVFIGSSSEALTQAERVAEVLTTVPGVSPALWNRYFHNGDINLEVIERLSDEVGGAVFLLTPDVPARVREQDRMLCNSNVLFEYAFLSARLGRRRVALACYDGVYLLNDLDGMTHIRMGPFNRNGSITPNAARGLREWAERLPATQTGLPSSALAHGYSGLWHIRSTFSQWRQLEIARPDQVVFDGQMVLHLSSERGHGQGAVFGRLAVQVGDCYAEFRVTDEVLAAQVEPDGSLRMRSRMHSRQRMRLEGTPPQANGFGARLRNALEFDTVLRRTDREREMAGEYISYHGDVVYSRASERYTRSAIRYD